MHNPASARKGFTLIELLIVIAIVAILAVVVVIVLNPSELIKQSRDSGRLNDLSTLKSAIALYLTDVYSSNLASSSAGYAGCYLSTPSGVGTTTAKCGVFTVASITTDVSSSVGTYRTINSSGWVPVDFTKISVGTPLGSLPVDPVNNGSFYYAYAATVSSTFEIDAFLESKKYGSGGPNDAVTGDGGNNTSTYEQGTNLSL